MIRIAFYMLICAMLGGCVTELPRNAAGQPRLERVGEERVVHAPRAPLSLPELARMEKSGVPTPEIVARLRGTGQKIAFDAGAQARLRELGASENLLQALRDAEAQARETDRINAEVDRKARERREYVYSYAYPSYYAYPASSYPYNAYPYWGRFYPYIGYSWGHYHRGWGSGIYWSW